MSKRGIAQEKNYAQAKILFANRAIIKSQHKLYKFRKNVIKKIQL